MYSGLHVFARDRNMKMARRQRTVWSQLCVDSHVKFSLVLPKFICEAHVMLDCYMLG